MLVNVNVGSSLRVSRLVESFLHEICKVLRISGIQFAHPTETHSSRSTCLKTTTISFLSGTLAVHAKNAVVVLIETFLTPRSQTHNNKCNSHQLPWNQAHTRRTLECQILTGSLVEGAHKLRYHVKLCNTKLDRENRFQTSHTLK